MVDLKRRRPGRRFWRKEGVDSKVKVQYLSGFESVICHILMHFNQIQLPYQQSFDVTLDKFITIFVQHITYDFNQKDRFIINPIILGIITRELSSFNLGPAILLYGYLVSIHWKTLAHKLSRLGVGAGTELGNIKNSS